MTPLSVFEGANKQKFWGIFFCLRSKRFTAIVSYMIVKYEFGVRACDLFLFQEAKKHLCRSQLFYEFTMYQIHSILVIVYLCNKVWNDCNVGNSAIWEGWKGWNKPLKALLENEFCWSWFFLVVGQTQRKGCVASCYKITSPLTKNWWSDLLTFIYLVSSCQWAYSVEHNFNNDKNVSNTT